MHHTCICVCIYMIFLLQRDLDLPGCLGFSHLSCGPNFLQPSTLLEGKLGTKD